MHNHAIKLTHTQASRERLLTVNISVAESTIKHAVEQISELYKSGGLVSQFSWVTEIVKPSVVLL